VIEKEIARYRAASERDADERRDELEPLQRELLNI
jgi:hypothetical protein